MRNYLAFIFTTFASLTFGQVNPKIWDSLKTINTDYYEFQVPQRWMQVPTTGQGPEQYFTASGFPILYKGSPVIITIFLVKQNGKDLEDCKDKCLSGYRSNPDREFPKDFKDEFEKTKLAGGEKAYFLHTKFYRKSKGLNQSRYDLMVYSEKAKAGYMYTVSVQYADDSYQFETDNDLGAFAEKLYSYFKLMD